MGRSSAPSFYKLLIHDFSQELCLPADYINNFNDDVPKKFILTSSTRRSWEVSVKKVDSDLFLCDDWPIFAKHHALEFGDLLVFIYNGNSKFDVKIFGSNACEKEVELSMKNNVESNYYLTKEKEGEGREIPDKLHSRVMLKCYKRRRIAEAAVTDKMTSLINSISIKAERSEVLEVTHSYTATFRPYRKYRLVIPNKIVKEKGLAEKDSMMLLDSCGRSWPVTIYHKKEGGTMMTAGWAEFCTTNRLNTNDICLFQFIEGMGDVIRVEISRTRIKAPSSKQASADMAISTYTPKEVIETPTSKRPGEFVEDRPARENIKEECAELGFNLKESDEVNRVDINSYKCNELNLNPTTSVARRVVTNQDHERSIIAARAFTSENPFCFITMRPAYVGGSYCLNIPKDFADKYLKDAFQGITLRHSNRGSWHAGYRASYRKLGKGWKEFVFANHLQVHEKQRKFAFSTYQSSIHEVGLGVTSQLSLHKAITSLFAPETHVFCLPFDWSTFAPVPFLYTSAH